MQQVADVLTEVSNPILADTDALFDDLIQWRTLSSGTLPSYFNQYVAQELLTMDGDLCANMVPQIPSLKSIGTCFDLILRLQSLTSLLQRSCKHLVPIHADSQQFARGCTWLFKSCF